jgi:hypothetical protein
MDEGLTVPAGWVCVDEADLENANLEVETALFDKNRIYLDVEKRIGAKGGQRNILDGIFLT